MRTLRIIRRKRFSKRSYALKDGPITIAVLWLPSLLRPAEAAIGQNRYTFTLRVMSNHYAVRNDKGETVATYKTGRLKGGLLKTLLGLAHRSAILTIGNVQYTFEPHFCTYYTWVRLNQPEKPIMRYTFYKNAEGAKNVVYIGNGIPLSHSEILTVVGLKLALKHRSIRP